MIQRFGRAAVAVALVAAVSVVAPGAASARIPLIRVGQAARLPLFTADDGPVAPSTRLTLSVALAPRNAAALAALATNVSTPGTTSYGHFLSVRQFANRFGASPDVVSEVQSLLRAKGLSVGRVSADDLMLPVAGSASAIDGAMSADISRVALPDGRHAYANLSAPAFTSGIARDIQGVIGLDDVTPVQSAGLVRSSGPSRTVFRSAEKRAAISTGGPQPTCDFTPAGAGGASDSTDQNGYSYDQLASAYGFSSLYGSGDLGQGQTVALVELQPYSASDIQTFQSCYGTSATVDQINVGGGPSSDDNCNPGGACNDGESALDIETVIALAPKATVDVYEGPDTSGIAEAATVLNQIVSDDRAKVISSSFGACEAATPAASITAENTALQEAAVQGQSFFSASGDSGSETCSQLGPRSVGFSEGVSVEDPAAQPFATGVGGTTLFEAASNGGQETAMFDDDGASPDETVWNEGPNPKCGCGGLAPLDGFGGGSGGGISTKWSMPSYQSSAAAALGVIGSDSAGTSFCGAANCRQVPDVAADAAGLTGYIVFTSDNGAATWGVTAGTSAASPLWAAYMALVNASAACRGLAIGFANPALYGIAGSQYAGDFNDIQANSTFAAALESVDAIYGPKEIASNDTLSLFGVTASSNTAFLYPVTAGYDMATGLGSMQAGPLAAALCAARDADAYTVSVNNPGTQTSTTGKSVSLQLSASDSGSGTTLTYSASGLPAGLSIASGGQITGTPTTAGSGTVTVTATDQFTNTASTQFTWTVVTPPAPVVTTTTTTTSVVPPVIKPGAPVPSLSIAGLKGGSAKLSFRIAAGTNAPAISVVRILLPKGLSFAKRVKSLKKGISVTAGGAKVSFTTSGGGASLTLRFSEPETVVAIAVGKPALSEAKSLIEVAHRKKPGTIKVAFTVTDASGRATPFSTALKS